ncbi:TRAP transporter substrate-binding protein [Alteromonas confluentis]|uniref:ABC transporter substrate-binding protein n=1 Tax=Alteromonas confluentis TaxID=1656094 RepID=A0A1E7ZCH9_9ALTE|nr:TRAP transporter substrate-binding protein DctP [Alteromonas confluentis]OFC71200.1 hypothetical protein BFC18_08545 [Alteromonas confluentis]
MKYLLVFVLLPLCFACSDAHKTDVRTLTYASPYPPGHPFSQADIAWMESIEEASEGRIVFDAFWSGSLLSSDMSMMEIRHGVADIGLITPIYARGGTHVLRTQAGFYGGIASIDDQVALYKCLAASFPSFNRELEGLKVLAIQGGNFPTLITRNTPVNSLDDFSGLRLRVQSEAVALLKELGADPVNIPMGEVYPALAKGIIDGVVAPADTIYSMHFAEVAQHITPVKFSRGAYPARAMSEKVWQSLPADIQRIFEEEQATWEQNLKVYLQEAEQKGLDFARDNKMTFHSFSQQDQQQFDQLYNQMARKEAIGLNEFNVDGEAIFQKAQDLIQAGSPIQCNSGAPQ